MTKSYDIPALDEHCFREDNCHAHQDHRGPECCCCGQPPEAHTGCDCDERPDSMEYTYKGGKRMTKSPERITAVWQTFAGQLSRLETDAQTIKSYAFEEHAIPMWMYEELQVIVGKVKELAANAETMVPTTNEEARA